MLDPVRYRHHLPDDKEGTSEPEDRCVVRKPHHIRHKKQKQDHIRNTGFETRAIEGATDEKNSDTEGETGERENQRCRMDDEEQNDARHHNPEHAIPVVIGQDRVREAHREQDNYEERDGINHSLVPIRRRSADLYPTSAEPEQQW